MGISQTFNSSAKLVRLATLCIGLVVIIWNATSMQSTQNVYSRLTKPHAASNAADDLHDEFYGTVGSSSDLTGPVQAGRHNHAHHAPPNPSSKAESASLGLNGRPRLPPVDFIAQHVPQPKEDGSHLEKQKLNDYIDAIFNLDNSIFWRLECPEQHNQGPRYQVLRELSKQDPGIKYFFALDLYNIIDILPRLLGSIIQVIKFLGAENCALSIIEGRSHDGTYSVLYGIQEELSKHGVQYWLDQSDINPHADGVDRIEELSKLRNMALEPLTNPKTRPMFSDKPVIMFVNDVAICPDDLLEMMYQHLLQNATQTCAMDWVDGGDLFYDAWVSRSMSGNTFFEIPQDMSWAFSRNMFWDEPDAYTLYREKKPFQVFSCWGGMVVLDSAPFIDGQISFRRNVEGECYGGEPQTLASDLVKIGMSRVQTLPYVHVAYSNHEAERVKKIREYVHDVVNVTVPVNKFEDDKKTQRVKWKQAPPRYRCMPGFNQQWWVDTVYVPGDEHLQ